MIEEARNNGRKVHFALLMDLCHLKNSQLKPRCQRYKGRVVLRGDIVKDDSGAYAVFTEQGSSASQMTAAKVMDGISRPPGCAGQAADAVSASTQLKTEDATIVIKNSNVRNVRIFGYVYHKTNGQNHGQALKIQRFVLNEICTDTHSLVSCGKDSSRIGRKFQIGNVCSLNEKKDYSCLCMWTT